MHVNRFRISIRFIFFAVLISALIICFFTPEIRRRLLIRKIEAGGGSLIYNPTIKTVWRSEKVEHIQCPPKSIPGQALTESFPHVQEIGLGLVQSKSGITGSFSCDVEDYEDFRKQSSR